MNTRVLLCVGSCWLIGCQAIDYTFQWQYSLYPPYVNGKGVNSHWDMDAFVNNHHFVQLTPDLPSRSGWVFTKEKLASNSWFIEATFSIKAEKRHNAGDGMAIWFTEESYKPGEAFGYTEFFKGLGIFIDLFPNTRHNHRFPYLGAMVNDGTKRYDHDNDGGNELIGGCHVKVINNEIPVHAKIIYNAGTLEVLTFTSHQAGWSPCFKVANVKLPSSGYIGATALTGAASASHEIVGITTGTYSVGKADSFAYGELDDSDKSHSRLFFLLLLVAGLGFGYNYWREQKKRRTF